MQTHDHKSRRKRMEHGIAKYAYMKSTMEKSSDFF